MEQQAQKAPQAAQAGSLYDRYGYGSARELFGAVMDAAQDMEAAARQMELMDSRMGLHAQRYDAPHVSGGVSDPTAAAAALGMQQHGRLKKRQQQDAVLIAYGASVCYGEDGTGGVCGLMGGKYADALYSRYCLAHPWRGVAADMGMSQHGVRNLIDVALDMLDSCGVDRVRREGAAASVTA